MSFPYDRYDRSQRRGKRSSSAFDYWVPLGVTVAAAVVGLAIWAWKEHQDNDDTTLDEDDEKDALQPKRSTSDSAPRLGGVGKSPSRSDAREIQPTDYNHDSTMAARMSGAIKRGSRAQNDLASGSQVKPLGTTAEPLVEKSADPLELSGVDAHLKRWPAESEIPQRNSKPKRMIAVVVSANTDGMHITGSAFELGRASILSRLSMPMISENVELIVLVHTPKLRTYDTQSPRRRTESMMPSTSDSANDNDTASQFTSLQAAALPLVRHPTNIIPFSTSNGHIHLLRHLAPSLVYVEETLCGTNGELVKQIADWVGQIIIVVGGAGLAPDTETEDESSQPRKQLEWWRDATRVGLGKAEVVESVHFAEDWAKRAAA